MINQGDERTYYLGIINTLAGLTDALDAVDAAQSIKDLLDEVLHLSQEEFRLRYTL